ncbi:MAG: hypothetical protein AB7G06_07995 [Bdellovibrionales bacterium]
MSVTFHAWQFAANAEWERALVISAATVPDIPAVETWVEAQPQNVAFEAVFAIDGQPAFMYGVRITQLEKPLQVACLRRLVAATADIRTPEVFIELLHDCLEGHRLFEAECEKLNVGIVGQWYSFGEVALYDGADAPMSFAELQETAPQFFERTQNPAAIEFWYTQPLQHWYKIYVSDPINGGYRINEAKYNIALQQLY